MASVKGSTKLEGSEKKFEKFPSIGMYWIFEIMPFFSKNSCFWYFTETYRLFFFKIFSSKFSNIMILSSYGFRFLKNFNISLKTGKLCFSSISSIPFFLKYEIWPNFKKSLWEYEEEIQENQSITLLMRYKSLKNQSKNFTWCPIVHGKNF